MNEAAELQEMTAYVGSCTDRAELQEIKELVDSLRTTVENRIKAVESEGE